MQKYVITSFLCVLGILVFTRQQHTHIEIEKHVEDNFRTMLHGEMCEMIVDLKGDVNGARDVGVDIEISLQD